PADDRTTLAPDIEELLREGLNQAATTSQKAAWFSALRSMALTPDTLSWLEQVWAHDVTIDKLPLAETDDAELALELALREIPERSPTLETQSVPFKNPDRRARFLFVMPAVSPDPAVRDKFFDSLKDVNNRAHEAWVLDAVRYLNHPLRASTSKKYIL